MDKLKMQSVDIVSENIDKLFKIFPNCVSESSSGKVIDLEQLKQELSANLIEGNKERYRIEWPGKKEAIVTANLPITKTLRPIKEDSIDYDNTENVYIEGDNLEVLKLLQGSYLNTVKIIFIDPPYNTGKDFIYKDNFAKDKSIELFESGQKDELGQRLVVNPETSGRYHSDWLSMMYPRLKLARNLLTDDGVILISIGDSEVNNLRKMCDEIFGEANFVAVAIWEKKNKGAFLAKDITNMKDYIVIYAKNKDKFNGIIGEIAEEEETYPCVNAPNAREIRKIPAGIKSNFREKNYKLKKGETISVDTMSLVLHSDLVIEDGVLSQELLIEGNWRYKQEAMTDYALKGELYLTQDLYLRRIVKEPRYKTLKDILPRIGTSGKPANLNFDINNLFYDGWGTNEDANEELRQLLGEQNVFDYPKPTVLIAKLLCSIRDKSALVLDFFSGSGTTAHSVNLLNSLDGGSRRYILIQLPEATAEVSEAYKAGYKNICEIGKERIRRAAKKIQEETNADIDYGFRVYRLDESNMQNVYYHPQDYDQSKMDAFVDNVKPDRSAEDLLVQVMIDWGLPLNLKIEQIDITGKQVYKVAGDSLYACFEKSLDENFAKEIAKNKPLRIVCRDNSFKDNSAKTNVKQLLKQLSPETELKVI